MCNWVDDILGEESDNESEGQGKERPGEEEVENDDDEEDEDQQQQQQQQQQQHQQQLGAGASTGGEHTAPSLAVAKHTGLQTPGTEACLTSSVQRARQERLAGCYGEMRKLNACRLWGLDNT
ncbi:unnamed protein product [Boreogadus saida]